VPIFPRAVTVINKQLAAEMLAAMGDRDVVLMQGHGITVYSSSVETATALAIRFDRMAQIMWNLAQSGLKAYDIAEQDMPRRRDPQQGPQRLPLRSWGELEGTELWPWKYYVRLLSQQNNLADLLEEAKQS
jgi:hypothetical protein